MTAGSHQPFHFRDREQLMQQIAEWNASRLDLFEISPPNEKLEFHGVMRFFFQAGPDGRFQTKCVRVSSAATTRQLMSLLIEKFHPDMSNVRVADYALYEHLSTGERRVSDSEHPLLVQLLWGKDAREGKFVLKNETAPPVGSGQEKSNGESKSSSAFKRLWGSSKRKRQKQRRSTPSGRDLQQQQQQQQQHSASASTTGRSPERLAATSPTRFGALPDSSFTRTISNPEEVMRRKREQKLQRKMRLLEDGTTRGGTLRVYGEQLSEDVPYKTLLLTTRDTAAQVVRETLEKYGRDAERPGDYCLVKVLTPPRGEQQARAAPEIEEVLADDDQPLALLVNFPPARGTIAFHIRRRPMVAASTLDRRRGAAVLVDLAGGRRLQLPLHKGEARLGSAVNGAVSPLNIQLQHRQVGPLHCLIARDRASGQAVVRPVDEAFPVLVNDRRIAGPTRLEPGSTLRLGHDLAFLFELRQTTMETPTQPQPQNTAPVVLRQRAMSPGAERPTSSRALSPEPPPLAALSPGHLDPELLPAWLVPAGSSRAEDRILDLLVVRAHPNQMTFRLAPAYLLYLLVRAALREGPSGGLSARVNRIAGRVYRVARASHDSMLLSTFWMANAAELLHFIKYDQEVKGATLEAQDILAEAVQQAFNNLFQGFQFNLAQLMDAFLDRSDADLRDDVSADDTPLPAPSAPRPPAASLLVLLQSLSTAMHHLRQCCANAALTIQLFSQLFHFVNQWLFNRFLLQPHLGLLQREWGARIGRRLDRLKGWAERQGLELAADCHLQRICQACELLRAPKSELEALYNLSVDLVRLNSVQLRALLSGYLPGVNEPQIPAQWIDFVASGASQVADKLLEEEQSPVQLEEEVDLDLPLLLPDDGYSCDIPLRGLHAGLLQFAGALERAGLARLVPNPKASGLWTVHMYPYENGDVEETTSRPAAPPPAHTIFVRKINGSLGLSIVTAKGSGQAQSGVFVKAVVRGGSAARDGRLVPGDQLLEVDGTALTGASQETAAALIQSTGEVVRLTIVKEAARQLGIQHLIEQGQPSSPDAISPSRAPQLATAPSGPPPASASRAVRSPDLFPPRHQITVSHRVRPESARAVFGPTSPPPVTMAARAAAGPPQNDPRFAATSMPGGPTFRTSTAARGPNSADFGVIHSVPVQQSQNTAARAAVNGPGYASAVARHPAHSSAAPRGPARPQSATPLSRGAEFVTRQVATPQMAVSVRAQNGATAPPVPPYPKRLGGTEGRAMTAAVERKEREARRPGWVEAPASRDQRDYPNASRPPNYVNLALSAPPSFAAPPPAVPSMPPSRRRLPPAPSSTRPTPSRSTGELRALRSAGNDAPDLEFSLPPPRLPQARSAHDLEAQRVHEEFEARLRAEAGLAGSDEEDGGAAAVETEASSARARLATLQRLLGDMEARKRQRAEEDRRLREMQDEQERLTDMKLQQRLAQFQMEKEEERERQRERAQFRQRQQEETKRKQQEFLAEQSRIEAEREAEILRLESHKRSQRAAVAERRRSDHGVMRDDGHSQTEEAFRSKLQLYA